MPGAMSGGPLTLAAGATAAGFLAFLPTNYQGVSELGAIAGMGMIIAFLVSITLLPALLAVINPPGEKEPLGYASLAPVDKFVERNRIPVVVGTLGVAIVGLPLLYFLHFDFNPLNLRSSSVESISTYLELRKDPNTGASAINVLANSRKDAQAIAQKMAKSAGSVARHDDRQFRARGSAGQARDDPARPRRLSSRRSMSNRRRSRRRRRPARRLRKPPTLWMPSLLNPVPGANAGNTSRRAFAKAGCRVRSEAQRRRTGFRGAAGLQACRDEEVLAGASGHRRKPAGRHQERMGNRRRQKPRRGVSERRSERQRDAAHLRQEGAGGRAECHRRPDLDPEIGRYDRRSLHSGRPAGAALDQHSAVAGVASHRRRAAHHRAAAARRRDHDGDVRRDRPAAELCEHHRAAVAARHRRRVQDLLHHGVAGRADRSAAIESYARGVLQRADHRDRVRKPVAVKSSRARPAWASFWRCRSSRPCAPPCCFSRL